jgi:hypothetical protein
VRRPSPRTGAAGTRRRANGPASSHANRYPRLCQGCFDATPMTDSSNAEPGIPDRCPHCGAVVDRAKVLAIAEGSRLPPDPILGAGESLRFQPSRFDVSGRPIDPSGVACRRLACRACRLEIAALDGMTTS